MLGPAAANGAAGRSEFGAAVRRNRDTSAFDDDRNDAAFLRELDELGDALGPLADVDFDEGRSARDEPLALDAAVRTRRQAVQRRRHASA